MPLFEYKCSHGHTVEKYFHSFDKSPEDIVCMTVLNVEDPRGLDIDELDFCGDIASRAISTGFIHTYGEGFHKQSEIGPVVNKQDVTKVVKEFTAHDQQGNRVGTQHANKLGAQMKRLSKSSELGAITRNK